MSNSHLTTAHQYGVNEALKQCGYKSAEEVTKEAAELGLLEQPAETKTAQPTGGVFDALKQKLGR